MGSRTRLAEKKAKRDLDWSDGNVRELERYAMNTGTGVPTPADELIGRHRHLRLDSTDLTADQAADRILAWLAHGA